jgi:soluble lytic murein transglycosylase-like protein
MKYLAMVFLFIPSVANSDFWYIKDLIDKAEVEHELPKGYLRAIAFTESSFNTKAFVKEDGRSKKSSYGILQIQYDTAVFIQKLMAEKYKFKINKKNKITRKQLLDAEININYGAFYLKWILNQKEDYSLTLSCYNAGINSFVCKNKKYSPYVGLVFNAYIEKK